MLLWWKITEKSTKQPKNILFFSLKSCHFCIDSEWFHEKKSSDVKVWLINDLQISKIIRKQSDTFSHFLDKKYQNINFSIFYLQGVSCRFDRLWGSVLHGRNTSFVKSIMKYYFQEKVIHENVRQVSLDQMVAEPGLFYFKNLL